MSRDRRCLTRSPLKARMRVAVVRRTTTAEEDLHGVRRLQDRGGLLP
jgi:hypothetical protein